MWTEWPHNSVTCAGSCCGKQERACRSASVPQTSELMVRQAVHQADCLCWGVAPARHPSLQTGCAVSPGLLAKHQLNNKLDLGCLQAQPVAVATGSCCQDETSSTSTPVQAASSQSQPKESVCCKNLPPCEPAATPASVNSVPLPGSPASAELDAVRCTGSIYGLHAVLYPLLLPSGRHQQARRLCRPWRLRRAAQCCPGCAACPACKRTSGALGKGPEPDTLVRRE